MVLRVNLVLMVNLEKVFPVSRANPVVLVLQAWTDHVVKLVNQEGLVRMELKVKQFMASQAPLVFRAKEAHLVRMAFLVKTVKMVKMLFSMLMTSDSSQDQLVHLASPVRMVKMESVVSLDHKVYPEKMVGHVALVRLGQRAKLV